jgi:hypothetical protein
VPVVVVLEGAENLVVQPGQTTTCRVSLANTGTIVEQFTILMVGDVAEWASSDPPVVSLFPGAQQTATITFTPPRQHTTIAGLVPFGVKVIPSNEPEESVTEEGYINVGGFTDLGAELLPRQVMGRIGGRQRLAIDSNGNTPMPVAVNALDGADALKFKLDRPLLTIPPGGAEFVKIRIRPRKRFWRGPQKVKPYQVQVLAEGERPLALDGSYNQRAVLPGWVYLLAGLLAILALLWFLVLKPAVHNTAVQANKAALEQQAAETQALQGQVAANQNNIARNAAALAAISHHAATTTTTTTTTVPKATTTTTTVPKPTTTTTAPPVTGPTDGSLPLIVAGGQSGSSSIPPVPAGTTMTVTDLVLQTVTGSQGTARIQRVIPGQPTQTLLVQDLGTLASAGGSQTFTFTTPMVFTHDQQLQISVTCTAPTVCETGLYYSGPLTEPATATTTTIP